MIWLTENSTSIIQLNQDYHTNSYFTMKPDDEYYCFKNCIDLHRHIVRLQTSQGQIHQEMQLQETFGNVTALFVLHYTTDETISSYYKNVKSTITVQYRHFIETFIIRDKVLQHSVSHTFCCSDTFSINSI